MNTRDITQYVNIAKEQEAHSYDFLQHINSVTSKLHHNFNVSQETRADALISFSDEYIRQLPELIQTLGLIAEGTRLQGFIERMSAHIYMAYHELNGKSHIGMLDVLMCTFFSFRLIEEINDQCQHSFGIQLIPVDIMVSNLVGHAILGDAVANYMDKKACSTATGLMSKKQKPKNMGPADICLWQKVIQEEAAITYKSSIGFKYYT